MSLSAAASNLLVGVRFVVWPCGFGAVAGATAGLAAVLPAPRLPISVSLAVHPDMGRVIVH